MKKKLIEVLGLPKSASEQDIIANVTKLVKRNRKMLEQLKRERRIRRLIKKTNMTPEQAIETIKQQEAAASKCPA